MLTKKYSKFDFGWGSAPDPTRVLTVLPHEPLAGLKGSLLLRKKKEG